VRAQARIAFRVLRVGAVRLRLYDVRGRLVTTLIDAPLAEGDYETTWRRTDERGARVPAGVYFARLDGAGGTSTRKLVVGH